MSKWQSIVVEFQVENPGSWEKKWIVGESAYCIHNKIQFELAIPRILSMGPSKERDFWGKVIYDNLARRTELYSQILRAAVDDHSEREQQMKERRKDRHPR
jgi:hypothetical protein